jgi:hypothetical protein
MEQTILLVSSNGSFDVREVRSYLEDGWLIVAISAPSIPSGSIYSQWLVVLEKDLTEPS